MEVQVNREERLTLIENVLFQNPEGLRVVELADLCGVDRRTIYRDIARLRANGVPIYQRRGRFCVSREHYHATVQLTFNETIALFMAVRVVAQRAEQQNPHAIAALSKLSSGLPTPMAAHVEYVSKILKQKPVDRLFSRIADVLVLAWSEQRWVRLWTTHGDSQVEIAPYFMEASVDGATFVVGLEASTQQVRVFRMNHIVRCELLSRTYQRHEVFQPSAYLADQTGTIPDEHSQRTQVVLAFKPQVARLLLSKQFNAVINTEYADDGRTHITLLVNDEADLTHWLRGFGADVEIIAPHDLRKTFAKEAEQLHQLYTREGAIVTSGE